VDSFSNLVLDCVDCLFDSYSEDFTQAGESETVPQSHEEDFAQAHADTPHTSTEDDSTRSRVTELHVPRRVRNSGRAPSPLRRQQATVEQNQEPASSAPVSEISATAHSLKAIVQVKAALSVFVSNLKQDCCCYELF
jgi:hypothetical protein